VSYHDLFASWLADWHFWAAVLSGAFSVWSVCVYLKDMFRGETRPNIVSVSLWTICQIIALVAQWRAGASFSLVLMVLVTFNTLAVLWYALRGYGYREYDWFDLASLLASILAIVLWQATDNPVLAIIFSIAADLFATLPTLKKIGKVPQSEPLLGWFLVAVASVIGSLSSEIRDTANLAFPIYLFLVNGGVFLTIYFARRFARA
jgi:hypothetical protein